MSIRTSGAGPAANTLTGPGTSGKIAKFSGTTTLTDSRISESGTVTIFNASAEDWDVKMSGVSSANLFYMDASTNRVGIGTSTPGYTFDVIGSVNASVEVGGNTLYSATTTKGGDGAVGAPAFAFNSDADCGMYRIGTNNIGLAVNGAKVLDVGTTGLAVTGLLSCTTTLNVTGLATFTNAKITVGGYDINFQSASSTYIGNTAGDGASGASNTAVGSLAGTTISTATGNAFFGRQAGYKATGTENVCVGFGSGQSNTFSSSYNVFVGTYSGYAVTSGASNTLLGKEAGDTITTGLQNVCLGAISDVNSASAQNRIAIGYNAQCLADNTIQLGNASITDVVTVGKLDISGISAGSPNMKITGTTDTPSVTWATAIAGPSANPAGYMEILVGSTPYYIPYWA